MNLLIVLLFYLAKLLKENPEKGLREIFRTFQSDVITFLMIKLQGNRELAEELYQEAALAFIRSAGSGNFPFENDTKIRNYLLTIAVNKLRDYARKNKSTVRKTVFFRDRETLDQTLEDLPSLEENQETRILTREQETAIKQLVTLTLNSLRENHRKVLQLKFMENLSNQSIAERMQIGIKAAESLLYRAREEFRRQIRKNGLNEELYEI